MRDKLAIWTVFDHPTDNPDFFVARLSLVDGDGPKVTEEAICTRDLAALRLEMTRRGLTRLERFDEDAPNIVEVWL